MKRLLILCMLLGLLTACGTAPTPEPSGAEPEIEEAVPELEIQPGPDDIDPETGDRVLSSVEAVVDGGRALRLDAVGQPLTEPGAAVCYGVWTVRVYDGEELLQTIPVGEATGAGMTRSPTVEAALVARDMNFDGADDMELCATMERNAPPRLYFLWNSDANAYLYGFTLRGAEPDPETRQVVAEYPQDSQVELTDYLRYEDNGSLRLVSRKAEDWKRGSEDFPLTQYYEFVDGEAVLLREEFTDYNDEGLTVREVREIVDGELKPVRIEILEGGNGEFYVVRTEEIPQDIPEAGLEDAPTMDSETEDEYAPIEDDAPVEDAEA